MYIITNKFNIEIKMNQMGKVRRKQMKALENENLI